MNKLLSIGLAGLCTLTLVGCGSNETDSSANTSKEVASEKAEREMSNKELKSIFTSLSDSFVDMQSTMINGSEKEIIESADKALELTEKTKKDLLNEKSDAAKDLQKYSTMISELAVSVKILDTESISTKGKPLGEQIAILSKNHFDGYIPESVNKMISKSNEEKKDKTFGLDEWWEVEGGWKLKINSVTRTDERNRFSDKTPAQVVVINYTYENLGYEGISQDLYMKPSNVIDSGKLMAETYPSGASTSPKPTPIGAIMDGAEYAYGLQTEGGEITINFTQRDNQSEKHSASFVVPISN